MRARWAGLVALIVALGCGGTPVSIQVGDKRIEIGDADRSQPDETAGTTTKSKGSRTQPASAKSQIQLTTGRGIAPQVDGVAMVATSDGWFLEVQPGKRELVVYNLLGTRKAQTTVQAKGGRRHVYSWDGRSLAGAGETAAGAIPTSVIPECSLVLTGLLVADSSAVAVAGGKQATRQADGTLRVDGLAPGRHSVRITAGGFDLYDGPVDVQWGGETRCAFALGNGAWVPDCKHTP